MKSLVTLRVNTGAKLTEAEKDCIAWWVLSGCNRNEAFALFCRPELKDSRLVLDKVASQFFASEEVLSYAEAYKAAVTAELEAKKPYVEATISSEEMKYRKERAMQQLMNYVIEQADNISDVEDKESIIKFADKLGLLENVEEKVESPRRYLPETCSRCRYKAFVEANCTDEED